MNFCFVVVDSDKHCLGSVSCQRGLIHGQMIRIEAGVKMLNNTLKKRYLKISFIQIIPSVQFSQSVVFCAWYLLECKATEIHTAFKGAH